MKPYHKIVTRASQVDPIVIWHQKLMKLAKNRNLEWVVSDDLEDHRDAYENGDSIEEEFNYQVECI